MKALYTLVLCLIISCLMVSCVYGGFTSADYGLSTTYGTFVALGDFNNDKKADIAILNSNDNKHTVTIYLWDDVDKYIASDVSITEDLEISNVILGDFNYDGFLDILTTGPKQGSTNGEYYVNMYFGNGTSLLSKEAYEWPSVSPIGQLAVIHPNGDMRPSFIGTSYDSSVSQYKRTLWIFNGLTEGSRPLYTSSFVPLPSGHTHVYMSVGIAPVMADMNGDCQSDIIIISSNIPNNEQYYPGNPDRMDTTDSAYDSTKMIEVWIFDKDIELNNGWGYSLHSINKAPMGILQPVAHDINRDGTTDIIIPQCWPYRTGKDEETCSQINQVVMYYNTQKPMCGVTSLSSSSCRLQSALCVADNDWSIGNFDSSSSHAVIVPSARFANKRFWFPQTQDNTAINIYNPPFIMRITDFDLDADMDVIFPLQDTKTKITYLGTYTSQTCRDRTDNPDDPADGACLDHAVDSGYHTLESTNIDGITYDDTLYTYAVAAIDTYGKGYPALFILQYNPTITDKTKQYTILPRKNKYNEDTYSLTLLGGNGVSSSSSYGTSQQSITFKFTITSLVGKKTPRLVLQGQQSAYTPLSTPYALVGLGRTSNYIEELFMGIPTRHKDSVGSFVAMMPNSQIFINPNPIDDPSLWTAQLFISPSEHLLAVFIAFVVTIILCSLVILLLHIRETRLESHHKAKSKHLFAF